jgi:PAS domain S-box-containing protein
MSTEMHAWLCQQIVDHAQDATIFADCDGVIRLWNAGAEAIFGYRTEEAVGGTLDLIIPAHLRARHWAGYRQVMATGVTRYGREVLAVPALRKDGTRISVEFTIILLRNAAGEVLGPAAIVRDVTARWQHDKALKERLAALEAQVKCTHGLAEDERRDGDTPDRGIPPG